MQVIFQHVGQIHITNISIFKNKHNRTIQSCRDAQLAQKIIILRAISYNFVG